MKYSRIISRQTLPLLLFGLSLPHLSPTAKAQEISPQPQLSSQLTTQPKQRYKQYEVTVFFAEEAAQRDSLGEVAAVTRQTNSLGVARFALQELIEGPTPAEQRRGLMDTIELRGESTCGGQDFTISLEQGVATVRFCRQVVRAGIGDDARIENAVKKTLEQFSTIQEVVLLNPQGDCLIDPSGENLCLTE